MKNQKQDIQKQKQQQQSYSESDDDQNFQEQNYEKIVFQTYDSIIKKDSVQKYLKNYEFQKLYLCDNWFKGFCLFPKNECLHSHGIFDLNLDFLEKNWQNQVQNPKNYKKTFYKTFPKINLNEGHRNYVQLIDFVQQNTDNFNNQEAEKINFDKALKHKIRKQYQCQIIYEITQFLHQKYGENFTLDIFNKILSHIFVDQQYSMQNDQKSQQKPQNYLWQKLIEKVQKLRKNFYITRNKQILNEFQQPSYFIVKVPPIPELNQYMVTIFIKACKIIQNEQAQESKEIFPISQERLIEFLKNNEDIYYLENYQKNYSLPTFKQYFEIVNLQLSQFLEKVFFQKYKYCEEIGITKEQQLQIKEYYQTQNDIVIGKKKIINKKSNNKDHDDDEDDDEEGEDQENNIVEEFFRLDSCNKKRKLNEKEIQQRIKEYLNSKIDYEKESLCRFYLRGCCRFTKQECKYAHDLEDLIKYKKVSQYDREIDFKYTVKDYDQRPLLQTKRVQYSLFDYQKKLIKLGLQQNEYSLDEITDNKKLRVEIRDKMHKQMMIEFYQLLLNLYKGDNFYFTDKFLIGEYNRVGFNKIGNKIHLKQILSSLSNTLAYEVQISLPPNIKQKNKSICILPIPEKQTIIETYKQKLLEIVKTLQQEQNVEQVYEQDIKKVFYRELVCTDMPLHQFLQYVGWTFKEYVEIVFLSQDNDEDIEFQEIQNLEKKQSSGQNNLIKKKLPVIFDFDKEKLQDQLKQNIQQIMLKGNKWIYHLEELENQELLQILFGNNPDYQNQNKKGLVKSNQKAFDFIRQYIVLHNKQMLIFNPIYTYVINLEIKKDLTEFPIKYCNCQNKSQQFQDTQQQLKKSEDEQSQLKLSQSIIDNYLQKPTILVDDLQTILYSKYILENNFGDENLGVDLEGHLNFGGDVELIQISVKNSLKNNEIQIFVFDIQELSQNKPEIFQICLVVLDSVLSDQKRVKIFHDSRKDSLAIHFILGICVQNVFDTSAVDMLISHIEEYGNYYAIKKQSQKETICQTMLKNLEQNIKWPGLNDVLSKYEASHGINETKQEMHSKFQDPSYQSYFKSRPIQQDYLEYSAKDVEDLIEVKIKMIQKLENLMMEKFKMIDKNIKKQSAMVDYLCLYISNDYIALYKLNSYI